METIISQNAREASRAAGSAVADLVRNKPTAVLGLATGGTPQRLYEELIRARREEGLDFSRVVTFNLDEYVGLGPNDSRSYHFYMWKNLFSHINIKPENARVPNGLAADVPASCAAYERAIAAAGGIDLQVLGLGENGHIGFNEPGSAFDSRTRVETLSAQTIRNNARFFGGDEKRVPRHSVTMGLATIMEARRILLLAFGDAKAAAVAAMIEGPVATKLPASVLQHHPDAQVFLDPSAAAALKRARFA